MTTTGRKKARAANVAGVAKGGGRQEPEPAVIAPPPARLRRARLFQTYVLIASALFVALAIGAHSRPYFAIDLTVTRAIQQFGGPMFDAFMVGISWLGFMPQGVLLAIVILVALFAGGLRWEATSGGIAALGIVLCGVVKAIVARPRPAEDLVHVFKTMNSPAFPSGHVVMAVTFFGYLIFLAYTIVRPSWGRTLALAVLSMVVGLMGVSRIALGQHWFSDVMGAYLLGSLWLALTIRIYRWGKPRYFADQPVAHPAEGVKTQE